RENDAEHSWHLAVMAMLLAEYANEPNIDLKRVMQMVLIHDIVEIDAGDTFCYDQEGRIHQAAREQKAADRLFGMLPADQTAEMRGAWDEFEAAESAESRYARALDRMQPLLHNLETDGFAWKQHRVSLQDVLTRNAEIGNAAPKLWDYLVGRIKDAHKKGWLL
ncbi:MAG: putative hydrolase of HD superfamily, partial [Rhodothermales bacterium]